MKKAEIKSFLMKEFHRYSDIIRKCEDKLKDEKDHQNILYYQENIVIARIRKNYAKELIMKLDGDCEHPYIF